MVELHSNFTAAATKNYVDGRRTPTQHAVHETLEITQGLTSWSEVGFYVFTSIPSGPGFAVGRRPYPSACARPGKAGTGR